jgi:hypothetical protein
VFGLCSWGYVLRVGCMEGTGGGVGWGWGVGVVVGVGVVFSLCAALEHSKVCTLYDFRQLIVVIFKRLLSCSSALPSARQKSVFAYPKQRATVLVDLF